MPGPSADVVWDVAAVSRGSLWVIQRGSSSPPSSVARWDSTRWRDVGRTLSSNGLAARSDLDVWAVGWGSASHWNGRRWDETRVPAPADAFDGANLLDVALSPIEAWGVGFWDFEYEGHLAYGVIYRWNGTAWKLVFKRRDTGVVGVAATSARDAWAVTVSPYLWHREEYGPSSILQWNGSAWEVSAGARKLRGARFEAVAASRGEVWAVGSRDGRAAVARYTR